MRSRTSGTISFGSTSANSADLPEQARESQRVEEPSPAGLAVLRGLATGLSRREIGLRLHISLNAVETHLRELYRKLGGISRADAIARVEGLGLLELSESPG